MTSLPCTASQLQLKFQLNLAGLTLPCQQAPRTHHLSAKLLNLRVSRTFRQHRAPPAARYIQSRRRNPMADHTRNGNLGTPSFDSPSLRLKLGLAEMLK